MIPLESAQIRPGLGDILETDRRRDGDLLVAEQRG